MQEQDMETRAVTLVDLPLLLRLGDKVTALDNEFEYAHHLFVPNSTLVTDVLLPQRGAHTLVSRRGKQPVVGQFRMRADSPYAQVVYLAPNLKDACGDDTPWLHILDAIAREAGKHAARALLAEIDESHDLFETLRGAGYAVYARQQIWRRAPGNPFPGASEAPLYEVRADAYEVQTLINQTVPPILQQLVAPPPHAEGWVYRHQGQTLAYATVCGGKNGVYMLPYLRPEAVDQVELIFNALIKQIYQMGKRPVYLCVRRYQSWITGVLERMRFEPGPEQAIMVKHLASRVQRPMFRPIEEELQALAIPAKAPMMLESPV